MGINVAISIIPAINIRYLINLVLSAIIKQINKKIFYYKLLSFPSNERKDNFPSRVPLFSIVSIEM